MFKGATFNVLKAPPQLIEFFQNRLKNVYDPANWW